MQHIMNTFTKYIEELDISYLIDLFFTTLFQLILTVLLLWLLKVLTDRLISIYFSKTKPIKGSYQRHLTLKKLLLNIVQYTYYFFLGYSILAILGVPVATLMAGAGIASVAIGLGAQGFVTDMVNGLFILLERQFDVGEVVSINNFSGTIENIGIRTTIIEDFNGAVHYVPNRNILNVTNESRLPRRADIDLMIDSKTDSQLLHQIIKETVESTLPNDKLTQAPDYWGLARDNQGRLVYRVRLMCKNGEQFGVQADYYAILTDALEANGIEQPLVINPSEIKSK